ncbi:hypothetical protein BDZ89DRAFT_1131040 [Hymenopellis radicata]|nr:hypothetical protein BDZ89DRAFT_1131040 [Hymenopellis radicata]
MSSILAVTLIVMVKDQVSVSGPYDQQRKSTVLPFASAMKIEDVPTLDNIDEARPSQMFKFPCGDIEGLKCLSAPLKRELHEIDAMCYHIMPVVAAQPAVPRFAPL